MPRSNENSRLSDDETKSLLRKNKPYGVEANPNYFTRDDINQEEVDNSGDLNDSNIHENLIVNTTNNSNGISWYFAVFLIVNAALGAGLLNFAKAFDSAGGIVISSIIQLVLVIVIIGALVILSYCTDNCKSANFQDVIYGMCGKRWQTINSICIILYMFGCCITFFIIIGDQLDQITSTLFILPLCYPKRIDFLTYPSTLAVIAIIYVVILIPVKYFSSKLEHVHVKTRPDHWTDVFSVIPVICFGYQCHVNAVPIYACLKRKTLSEFTKSIIVSIIIVFFSYTIIAIFGYLTFGVEINDDILASYDANDASVLVAIFMYLIKTYTSYPLNLFCARTAIEGLCIEMFKLNEESIALYERRRRVIIVTIWYLLSLAAALFIKNITFVINYLGALAAAFMFIFPGLCLLFMVLDTNANQIVINNSSNDFVNKKYATLLLIISVFYITLGVFIMGLVVTQSLMNSL